MSFNFNDVVHLKKEYWDKVKDIGLYIEDFNCKELILRTRYGYLGGKLDPDNKFDDAIIQHNNINRDRHNFKGDPYLPEGSNLGECNWWALGDDYYDLRVPERWLEKVGHRDDKDLPPRPDYLVDPFESFIYRLIFVDKLVELEFFGGEKDTDPEGYVAEINGMNILISKQDDHFMVSLKTGDDEINGSLSFESSWCGTYLKEKFDKDQGEFRSARNHRIFNDLKLRFLHKNSGNETIKKDNESGTKEIEDPRFSILGKNNVYDSIKDIQLIFKKSLGLSTSQAYGLIGYGAKKGFLIKMDDGKIKINI